MLRWLEERLFGPTWNVYGYDHISQHDCLRLIVRNRDFKTTDQVKDNLSLNELFVITKIERA